MIDDDGRRMLKAAGQVSAVGIEIVLCTVLGYFGGRWLDGYFGSGPYLTIFCGACGLGAAIKVIHRLIKSTHLDEL